MHWAHNFHNYKLPITIIHICFVHHSAHAIEKYLFLLFIYLFRIINDCENYSMSVQWCTTPWIIVWYKLPLFSSCSRTQINSWPYPDTYASNGAHFLYKYTATGVYHMTWCRPFNYAFSLICKAHVLNLFVLYSVQHIHAHLPLVVFNLYTQNCFGFFSGIRAFRQYQSFARCWYRSISLVSVQAQFYWFNYNHICQEICE